jgi:hypothetical protein
MVSPVCVVSAPQARSAKLEIIAVGAGGCAVFGRCVSRFDSVFKELDKPAFVILKAPVLGGLKNPENAAL